MRLFLRVWQAMAVWVSLATLLCLAGCADAPSPTQVVLPVVSPTTTAQRALPVVTRTPAPTFTAVASALPSATPTTTPVPTSPLPTQQAPTASATETPSQTPTTAAPSVEPLEVARQHQINGDYSQAIATYLAVLDDDPTPDEAREATFRLGECYLLSRDYAAAAELLASYVTRYPDDSRVPQAALMAARAHHATGNCPQAISLYELYLSHQSVLADLAYEGIGDCHIDNQDAERAITAYRQAFDSTSDPGAQANLREKVAQAYVSLGQAAAAVSEYDAILQVARIEGYRAQIEYLAGQVLAAAGQTEPALARYRRAVDRYPQAEYAYLSLIELVEGGVPVDEFQRGLVDYYAGGLYPEAYVAAIAAFDRYLATQAASKADEALYRKALSQRAVDQDAAALATLGTLVASYPDSPWLARARWETAVTLAQIGNHDQAVDAYRQVTDLFPADDLAPQALWQAGRLSERDRDYPSAAALYDALRDRFPAYENADQARWRAGLAMYRAGEQAPAIDHWQALLTENPNSSYRAASLYWLGKLGAEPEHAEEQGYWDQLIAASPRGFYAHRVRQMRAGIPVATEMITASIEPPAWDPERAEREALDWLRGWTQVPADTRLVTLPRSLAQRADIKRGQALLAVGLRRPALSALDGARAALWSDPVALAQLAFFFREQGFHGLAARSALRLASLWPAGSIYDAPLVVKHLAYPLAYHDLISAEAQARELDPLLLAALIRQESLFEPVAESYAGARGLGQVMPATGEGIARSLGLDGFVLDDLYRPVVSVKFGAYYLAVQMKRFDKQVLIALAAYNGGPGNALNWLEASGSDLDLFVEVITASESRRYLQTVYEQYLTYQELYRPENAAG